MSAEPLDEDLQKYLLTAMYDMHPRERMGAHWIMNNEWFNECRKLRDSMGMPLILPPMRVDGPYCIYGLPIEVSEDAGAPRLASHVS